MRKLAEFIVAKRKPLLVVFLLAGVLSLALLPFLKITYDMVEYMPDDSGAKQGVQIMYDQFGEVAPLTVMFYGLSDDEALDVQEELKDIPGVLDAMYEQDNPQFDKDGYSQYLLTVQGNAYSVEAASVLDEIDDRFAGEEYYTSGLIVDNANSNKSTVIAMAIAVVVLLIILFIMCASWFEPFLFLAVIGLAILINMGTNALLPSVSNTTNMIAAILQLALSMDYSIMLIDRYRQARLVTADTSEAMRNALSKGFMAIAGSSATTIVGLLCLVFMSFEIGKDMGLVLAKGVFISLMCILFVLPGLIISTDDIIARTKKPVPVPPMNAFATFGYKLRYVMILAVALLFVVSALLQGKTGIDFYTEMDDPDREKIESVFPAQNTIIVVYNNDDEAGIVKAIPEIEGLAGVNDVQAYGTTLGKELSSEEIAEQFGVERSFIDMLMYYHFKGDPTKPLTLHQFATFLLEDVSTNEQFSSFFKGDTKAQLELLAKFSNKDAITKQRTASDMAEFMGLDTRSIQQLYALYFSAHNGSRVQTITLPAFVGFLQNDILLNPTLSGGIDSGMRSQMSMFALLTNEYEVKKQRTSAQMAQLIGMPQTEVDKLFAYYFATDGAQQPLSLSVPVFIHFINSEVVSNPEYSAALSDATKQQLAILEMFTNTETISRQMPSSEIASLFGLSSEVAEQVYYLYFAAQGDTASWAIPLDTFITFLKDNVATNPAFAQYFTPEQKNMLSFLDNAIDIAQMQRELSSAELAALLTPLNPAMDKDFVDGVFGYVSSTSGQPVSGMKLDAFVHLLATDATLGGQIGAEAQNLMKLMDNILSVAVPQTPITSAEAARLLQLDSSMAGQAYYLYMKDTGALPSWTMSPHQFVSFLADYVLPNPAFSSQFSDEQGNNLRMLRSVMDLSLSGQTLTSAAMAQALGLDVSSVQQLYILYAVSHNDITGKTMSLETLSAFLAKEIGNNSPLAQGIDDSKRGQILQMNTIISSSLNHVGYTPSGLSQLLGINEADLVMLFYLYTAYYGDTSTWTLSAVEFVDYLIEDVPQNPRYASLIDTSSLTSLKTARTLMHSAVDETTYSPSEMVAFLSGLNMSNTTDVFTQDKMEVLYLYHAGMYEFDPSWRMSLYDFVHFMVTTVMPDPRFSEYFDEETRNTLIEANTLMSDGRGALIGPEYSRLIITTDYGRESDEVYSLLDSVDGILAQSCQETYIVGDSAVAWEMHKTFGDELAFITLITALAIFVIVALTFRSLAIPAILVLLIQCAVYITMSISYLQGVGIYYLALIIVQAILMGATIDYAILFTSYYRELRTHYDIQDSLKQSYKGSINTILTSGSILCVVTLVVGLIMSDPTTSQVCLTISKGAFIAILLVIVVLPGVLAALDRIICRHAFRA